MNHSALFRMKRSVKIGTYSFVMGVIVLAALIVANLLVGALPAKVTRFSMSDQSITEVSDETVKFVSEMKEDVTVYWLCEGGAADEELSLFLTRYEEAGKHVKVEIVDPLENPTFTSQYSDTTLSEYSLIVKSARRYTVVDYTDMFYYTNDFFSQELGLTDPMTMAQLETLCSQYSSIIQTYYGVTVTDYNSIHSFCGEAALTSALDYVTKEYIPHAYLLTGHGDGTPSDMLYELFDSMNIDVDELNLQTSVGVPEDANCLILYAPKSDISVHEATLIRDYLNAGGSLMLNTSPEFVESCPNVASVVELFGLSPVQGVVQEGDASFISGSQYNLVPTVTDQHTAAAYVGSSYLPQMPTSHAIDVAESLPSGVTVTPLFTTSDKANRVSVEDNSVTLGEAGQLYVAVAASKSITTSDGTAKTADLTWYGSTAAFEDTVAEATSGGNYYYYAATLSFMSETFVSNYATLAGVEFSAEYLTGLTLASVIVVGVVTVIVLPLVLLTAGIVIWIVRKRR